VPEPVSNGTLQANIDLVNSFRRLARHQRTTIAALYAAGDVVIGLDRISHAMRGGAATTISPVNNPFIADAAQLVKRAARKALGATRVCPPSDCD
jgi:hypothetical protein